MKLKIILAFNVLMLITGYKLSAQNWRFPDCRDLEITDLKFNDNQDSIYVTVHNDCDTCVQHFYTGIKVYENEDTLASNQYSTNQRTPNNNSEFTYKVKVLAQFSITSLVRLEMTSGICDSLSISNMVLGVNNVTNDRVRFEIAPNPADDFVEILNLKGDIILNIRIYDMNSKVVKWIEDDLNELSIQALPNGVYYIVIQTEKDVISKKLIVNH